MKSTAVKKLFEGQVETTSEKIFKGRCMEASVSLLAPQYIDMNYEYLLDNMPKKIFDLAEKILAEGRKRKW